MHKAAPEVPAVRRRPFLDGLQDPTAVTALLHQTFRWLLAAALIIVACFWPSSMPPTTFLLGGIQVNEPDHSAWVDALTGVGMNAVPVTVYAKQGDWDSDNLWFDKEAPSVVSEIRKAKAGGLKVVLILRVALDHAFERNRFLWHGMIMPRDEAALRSWFEKYTAFVAKWARISQQEGVDVLGISSEMNALTDTIPRSDEAILKELKDLRYWHTHYKERVMAFDKDIAAGHLWDPSHHGNQSLPDHLDDRAEANLTWLEQTFFGGQDQGAAKVQKRRDQLEAGWRQVIDAAREHYQGPLTYASNFDSYQKVAFWDALDVMGVNAYFKLRQRFDEPLGDDQMLGRFTLQWHKIFGDIEDFRGQHELATKPLLFTELGYTFRKNATFEPWSYTRFSIIEWGQSDPPQRQLVVWPEQPIDYRERRVAIDALHDATDWSHRAYFKGILYWKFSTNPDHADIEPFVMHVGPQSSDILQASLLRFLDR